MIAAILFWGVPAFADPALAPDLLLLEIERRDLGEGFLSGVDGVRDSLDEEGGGFQTAYELVHFGALGDELENRLGAGQLAAVGADRRVRIWGRSDWLSLYLSPSVALGGGCSESEFCTQVTVNEWFFGVERGGFRVGVGAEDRTLGPHERGSLVIGRDAAPWGALSARWRGEGAYGRVKVEGSVGMLTGERNDVFNPMILHMDFRYSPVSWYEVGLSRLSLFGGEGRPLPPLWELLVPLNPHVDGDPDQLEPDTDELAAIDMRFTIAIGVSWL